MQQQTGTIWSYKMNETAYRFCTTEDTQEAYQLMIGLTAYFLSIYQKEREEFASKNDAELEDDSYTAKQYETYIMSLLAGMRDRVQEEMDSTSELDEVAFALAIHQVVDLNWTRLYMSESKNATQLGKLQVAATEQANNRHLRIYKRWVASGDEDSCDICQEMNGTIVPIDEPFLQHGELIDLPNGDIFSYNYIDRGIATAHPNCRCTFKLIVEY